MPYISKEKRAVLDPVIDELHRTLVDLQMDDELNNMEGNINYTFTRLLMMVYGDRNSTRYSQINDAMGVLSSVQAEYYRKVAAPYEDQKSFENGEVERFTSVLCRHTYTGAFNPGYNENICPDCAQLDRNRERKEHFDRLDAMSIEERLRLIEEWIYDYKPPINTRDLTF